MTLASRPKGAAGFAISRTGFGKRWPMPSVSARSRNWSLFRRSGAGTPGSRASRCERLRKPLPSSACCGTCAAERVPWPCTRRMWRAGIAPCRPREHAVRLREASLLDRHRHGGAHPGRTARRAARTQCRRAYFVASGSSVTIFRCEAPARRSTVFNGRRRRARRSRNCGAPSRSSPRRVKHTSARSPRELQLERLAQFLPADRRPERVI